MDWNKFWNGYIDASELLSDILERSNAMDKYSFGTFCCMCMDEYCKANSLDVIELSKWLAYNIRIMNEKNGRY